MNSNDLVAVRIPDTYENRGKEIWISAWLIEYCPGECAWVEFGDGRQMFMMPGFWGLLW